MHKDHGVSSGTGLYRGGGILHPTSHLVRRRRAQGPGLAGLFSPQIAGISENVIENILWQM